MNYSSTSADTRPSLLVVGASLLQVPAIVRAREMGYRVVVIDQDAKAPGRAVCDDFYRVSTVSREGLYRVATATGVSGIVTIGTDQPMRAIAHVCARLGLPALSEEAALRATDKGIMTKYLTLNGVSVPRSLVIQDDDPATVVSKFGLPAVLKPVDNAGSRGVVRVDDEDEIPRAVAYSRSYSRSGRIMAQEFVSGPEFSVEMVIFEGVPHVVAVTRKITTGPPHFIEVGHSQPASSDAVLTARLSSVATRAAHALGLNDCGGHAEIILSDAGPKLIEIGARLGGDFIASHLTPLSTGVDIVGAVIEVSCGVVPKLQPRHNRGSAVKFLTDLPPSACNNFSMRAAYGDAGIIEAGLLPGAGRHALNSSADRHAYIIASGDNQHEAIDACTHAVSRLAANAERQEHVDDKRNA